MEKQKISLTKNASIFFWAMYSICNILFSFTLAQIFKTIETKDLNEFYKSVFITLFVIILQHIFQIIAIKLRLAYTRKKMVLINNAYFINDIKSKNDVDMSSYSSKTELIINNYLANQILIPYNIIQMTLAIIAYMWISPIFVAYLILVVGLMMVIPIVTNKKAEQYTKNYTDCSKNYINFLTNIFNGKRELNQYGAIKTYADKHEKEAKNLFNKYEKHSFFIKLVGVVSSAISFITFNGIIVISGFLAITGKLELALFMTAIQLMNYFISPVFLLVDYINQFQSIKSQIPNIKEIVNFESKSPLNINNKIELNNISFSYNSNNKKDNLINYPNIVIEKNKKYLITGKSGTGKSTLAKILSGEINNYNGNILIDGKPNLIDNIVYVPQSAHLFYGDILENILLDRKVNDTDITNALKLANINKELLNKSIDINSDISGGEKARVSLARSLALMPNIMIIDEPTANLDYNNSIQIIQNICNLKDLTLIVISHEKEEDFFSCFDEVIVL